MGILYFGVLGDQHPVGYFNLTSDACVSRYGEDILFQHSSETVTDPPSRCAFATLARHG